MAAVATGRVSKRDYDDVLIPEIEESLRHHDKLRLYYELGLQFLGLEPAAMRADFAVGVEHLSRWERIAVVTDVDWIRNAVNAFRFLMPQQVRVFMNIEATDARALWQRIRKSTN